MQHDKFFFFIIALLCFILFEPNFPTLAEDTIPRLQDRDSSPSMRRINPPSSSGQEAPNKQQPTTDQKFNLVFSKLAAMEQNVANLQNQVRAQAQQIAQLQQVISIHSGGTVTIQAPGTLKITAGGTLNIAGSTIDLKAAITGAHGILKADTMMTKTVIAHPTHREPETFGNFELDP